ncbi:MAG: GNAT family protein [Deltaproteobacteria bacterium]|nr:GNAT family protein [Deltaproteobacteria bacterium]
MWIQPVTLEGRFVRLEPLSAAHARPLWAVSSDQEIYRFKPYVMRSEDDMRRFIARAERNLASGEGLGFATIDRASGEPVGSSSYFASDAQHRRVEVGGTWVIPARQRTPINTEAKLLMLRHAFEVLGCLRVEFKTDKLNVKSRRALERIGAVEEGVFRNHMLMPDGRIRDSVYFSIIASEWPAVEEKLLGFLQ